jgi:hypothetical protein
MVFSEFWNVVTAITAPKRWQEIKAVYQQIVHIAAAGKKIVFHY